MFVVKIDLGNDAMQDPHDVAAALRHVADELERTFVFPQSKRVKDINGNTVGEYGILDDPD